MELLISGPCGDLEADLWTPEGEPRAAAIVCHPHPRYGGTMQNTVVFRTARALQAVGLAALRFNFRGVGASAGRSEGDRVEVDDAAAALDHLTESFPGLPLWGAGYSFGARTVAALAARDPRVARLVLIALPTRAFDCEVVRELHTRGLVLLAGEDEFGTLDDLRGRFPDLDPVLRAEEIPGTDHFFRGKTPELEERIRDWAKQELETSP